MGTGRSRRSQRAPRARNLVQHGRRTVCKLLDAGLAELADKGYQALRVDDVVRRVSTAHGTFYLYFASKEDLFSALVGDVLRDMRVIAGKFPVVTPDGAGRAALRRWVERFGELYMAHATIIRILTQADVAGETIWADGMRVLFGLGQAIAQGMTPAKQPRPAAAAAGIGSPCSLLDELTALACLTLLERVSYLFAVGVRLPRADMNARLSDIIYAAFWDTHALALFFGSIDYGLAPIQRVLAEHGPLPLAEILRLAGVRHGGPGVFSGSMAEVVRNGTVGQVGPDSYADGPP